MYIMSYTSYLILPLSCSAACIVPDTSVSALESVIRMTRLGTLRLTPAESTSNDDFTIFRPDVILADFAL